MPAIRRSSARLAGKANAATEAGTQSQVQDNNEQTIENSREKTVRRRKTASASANDTAAAGPSENVDLSSHASASVALVSMAQESEADAIVPAVLSFNFEESKQHLIQVDHRFEDLFTKMACKPFESLERVHPFR